MFTEDFGIIEIERCIKKWIFIITDKERLHQEIDILDDRQLQSVRYFIDSLKEGQNRLSKATRDESKLAVLYREFEEEDRILAETGMESYSTNLKKEDKI